MGTSPNDGLFVGSATDTILEEKLALEREKTGGEETGGDPGETNLPTKPVSRRDPTPHVP